MNKMFIAILMTIASVYNTSYGMDTDKPSMDAMARSRLLYNKIKAPDNADNMYGKGAFVKTIYIKQDLRNDETELVKCYRYYSEGYFYDYPEKAYIATKKSLWQQPTQKIVWIGSGVCALAALIYVAKSIEHVIMTKIKKHLRTQRQNHYRILSSFVA